MKNEIKILSCLVLMLFLVVPATAKDDHKGHDHGQEKSKKHDDHKGHSDNIDHSDHKDGDHKGHSKHDDHNDHSKHDGEDEHDHGHGGGKAVGKGKAIVEVDEKKGFRLSKEAIKTLKLKLTTVNGSSFNISKKTLVASKNKKGVYRFRAGFFKFLVAKSVKEAGGGYTVEVAGVDFGDQIVVDGLGLLRVADVYSTDKSEYGHSH